MNIKTKQIENEIYSNGEIKVSIEKTIKYFCENKNNCPNVIVGIDSYNVLSKDIASVLDIDFDETNEIGYIISIEDKIKFNDFIYDKPLDIDSMEIVNISTDELVFKVLGNNNYYNKFYVDLFEVDLRYYSMWSNEYNSTRCTIYKYHKLYSGSMDKLNKKAEQLTTEYIRQKNQHGSWGEKHFYEQYKKYFKFFRSQLLNDNDKLFNNFDINKENMKNKIKVKET